MPRKKKEGVPWVHNTCEVCRRRFRHLDSLTRCRDHRHFVPAVCECGAPYFSSTNPDERSLYSKCPSCRTVPLYGSRREPARTTRVRPGDRHLWRDGDLSFDDIVRAYEDRFDVFQQPE